MVSSGYAPDAFGSKPKMLLLHHKTNVLKRLLSVAYFLEENRAYITP